MNSDFLEKLPPLSPINFFQISTEVAYAKKLGSKIFGRSHLLQNTSELFPEERFAEVKLAWNEEGLLASLLIDKPFEECFFPHFREGDSAELFIDTRDLKTAGFATRFCHHFLFLPQKVGDMGSQEVSRFRSEDFHPLCDPEEIEVETHFGHKNYRLDLYLPTRILHGYDPSAFKRLGFTYRINRLGAPPQHFSVSSQQYTVEQQPSTWASLLLKS